MQPFDPIQQQPPVVHTTLCEGLAGAPGVLGRRRGMGEGGEVENVTNV